MISGRKDFNKEDILVVCSEEDLFKRYCTNFEQTDVSFISDLRTNDDHPSCRITDLGSGLRYKDFGTDSPATDIWGYLELKFNLDYYQVLERVANDLGVKPSSHRNLETLSTSTIIGIKKPIETPHLIIRIKHRDWLIRDKQYWYDKYGFTISVLNSFKVIPISHYWLEGGRRLGERSILIDAEPHSYCYDYYWNRGVFLRKIYQPYSTKRKWISNIDRTIVQGIANIPRTGNRLIITKSLKDIMTLSQLGYYAIAPNSETTWIPIEVWHKLESRFKEKIIFFDNDVSGLREAAKRSLEFKIPYSHIPIELLDIGVKDISDYREKFGYNKTHEFMRQVLGD